MNYQAIMAKMKQGIPLTAEEADFVKNYTSNPAPARQDPMAQMGSLPQPNEASPEQQFTQGELGQLGELGMYDENQAANERAMARAEKLRGKGGYQGGTYGRWNIPNPYNPWGDIAREAGATIGEYRAEKKAAAEREKAKKALTMYEERTRNPRGEISQMNAQGIEDIAPPPRYDLGEESPWEKIRRMGRRFV